jgi:AcrR family transcriptional regulator
VTTRDLTGYQREVAERNADAILDAAEDLVRSQGHVNISAVAVQAGVSRVTVYAHFPTCRRSWRQPSSVPYAGR